MSNSAFLYEPRAARVRFGWGSLSALAEEVAMIGGHPLVVTTPGQAVMGEHVRDLLGGVAKLAPIAQVHTPVDSIRQGSELARSSSAGLLVAVGGGSAIGLAKGIARQTGLPIIAVPTTYSGSECTDVWGETQDSTKQTGRDPRALARTIVYDPALTRNLPLPTSAASAMNAIAHAVEGLYSAQANPLSSLKAEQGIAAMAGGLDALIDGGDAREARSDLMYGGWLCGMVLAEVGMGLHHKLCHTLGGRLGLPHAEMHAVLLPHSLGYNRQAAPEADARVARALGQVEGHTALHALLARLPLPQSLAELGMVEDDIAPIAALAVAQPYPNPAPLDEALIARMLANALAGREPENLSSPWEGRA